MSSTLTIVPSSVGALPANGVPTERWVQEHIYWLYGFYLEPFQLMILMDLLGGGMFSIMLPTDHGKSTILKMSVVLSLILNPKQPNMVIKISRTAATQTLQTLAFTLKRAAEYYPYVEPKVRWSRTTRMPLVAHSFMIEGGDWTRVENPSVYAASVWEADLQGRRGRCHIDDIETEKEGRYESHREILEARVDSILRTIEDSSLFLFAFFGTPQHGGSIYFKIVKKLKDLGSRFKVIRLPVRNADGSWLMPMRAGKLEIHRKSMTRRAWKVAYELEPEETGKVNDESIDRCKDHSFPFCRTKKVFEEWLRETYDNAEELIALATYYIGYDPSAVHEFAIGAMCYIGREAFLLDGNLEPGGILEQVAIAADMWARYGQPIVVLERNGQQKAFRDVLNVRIPEADIQLHNTTHIKDDDKIGIPALIEYVHDERFHMPYSDNMGQTLSDQLIEELREYGPLAHPHLIPALWFTQFYHRKFVMPTEPLAKRQEPKSAYNILPVQINRATGAWKRAARS